MREMESAFQEIYVERSVWDTEAARRLLRHFPEAAVIPIMHYKDLFNRSRQNQLLQRESRKLILAKKQGQLVYPGAPVCQSFGNTHFYYTSSVMNCIFDCEYCYLQGMYRTSNLVIFLNLTDIFREVEELLLQHPVYLCVSFDTDLCALEEITGYVRQWMLFTAEHLELTIEIRTKSGRSALWDGFAAAVEEAVQGVAEEDREAVRRKLQERIIFAHTLSPSSVIEQYEHRTGRLSARLDCIEHGMKLGFPVRLCFDPMLHCPDWREAYRGLIEETAARIPMERVKDISVGSFRLSEDYLKSMRKSRPLSPVVQFPYENVGGYYQYPPEIMEEMEGFLLELLCRYVERDRIFRWKEQE